MSLPHKRWESYCVLTMGYERVGEPRLLGRHWTRAAAARCADRTVNQPELLARSLDSALRMRNGHMVFANAAVRDRETDAPPSFVHAEDDPASVAGTDTA